MIRIPFTGAILTLFAQTMLCADYKTLKDLHHHLSQGYNKQLRPVNESSDAVQLQMDLALTKVGDLESRNEMLVSWIEYSVTWQDQRMVWSELEYPGVDSIRVARTDVWTPDLEALALEDRELRGQHMLQISSRGLVKWRGSMKVKTSCPMALKKFPFDSHTCSIVISTSYHNEDEVIITEVVYKEGNTFVNGEWNLTSVEVKTEMTNNDKQSKSIVRLDVKLTRQSLYLIFNFLGPIMTINAVNTLVFLVKHQSGERISVAVTVFLSFTMFLSSLNDLLPRTSTSISLLSVVAYLQFQSSGGIVVSTIISHCLFHSTNDGCWVKFWATLLRMRKKNSIKPVDCDVKDGEMDEQTQGIDKYELARRFDRSCWCVYIVGSLAYAALTFIVPFV